MKIFYARFRGYPSLKTITLMGGIFVNNQRKDPKKSSRLRLPSQKNEFFFGLVRLEVGLHALAKPFD